MTNKQKHRPCFVARRPPKQAPVKEWAPLDNEDCDLVYKPSLCMSKMFGKRLLKFEGLLAGVYALHMIDSGASASFISTEFALSHGISCLPVDLAPAQLANNTTVPIDGVTNHLWMRIGPFATKHKFLVVDMPEYDVVLGLDFLSKHDPIVHWRKRKLSINVKGKTVMLNAYQEPELPNIQSDTIEFCNIDTFSRSCGSDSRIDIANACVGCLLPEDLPNIDNELLKGKGASHHRIAPLLSDYADVLRDKIPEGLPPERFAADGTPIEHVIEVAEGEKPYARNARPFTREEDEEVQRYLKEFMENGWIRPSLSPWAAPVLFVPKKPDPVTGKRSWRMCISYVALNSKTLNRIAYRLPRISELLSRISTAKYFSKMDLLSGFYQVRVRGNDIEKTAFTTPHGNFGWNKTYHSLAQHYYWPDMPTAVQDYVRRCPVCQRSKASKQPKPDLHPLPTPRRPFSWITLDWVSALPKSKGGNDGYLAIIDRFSKWAIVIPCTKHMSTAQLIELLYDKVFSWVGLPDCILGDRDSRLTADRIKRVMRSISVRLFHSTAYHPQTDGQTENFHRTFLSMLRAFVSKHQDDWEELIPSMLYAYHNTIHSATGFTPHKLLFGWSPRDLRAPMHNLPESDDPDFDFWLKERGSMLAKGQASIEHARQAMIDAHKSAPNAPQFKVNDLVKISSAFLRVRCTGKQVRKLLPKFVGPFTVLGVVGPNAYQIKLPDAYSGIHNVINVSYLRPYFPDPDREFEPDLPPIELHPTFNPVVQILDRRRHGRAPRDLQSHLDIPTQYLVIRKDGTTLWQPQSALQAPEEKQLIKRFELKFPRSDAKPCEPISAYITKETTEAELDSDDEVDLMLAQELEDRFGHE